MYGMGIGLTDRKNNQNKKSGSRDFPGGETLCSQCRGPCFSPGQRTRSHKPQLKEPTSLNKDPLIVSQLRPSTAK